MSKKLTKAQKDLKELGFPSFLKKCRKKYGKMKLVDASQAAGMNLRTYCRYESGDTLPTSLALAAGLLVAVNVPMRTINKMLYCDRFKPLAPAPKAMTRREESLIQWFDMQLEKCIKARKPLAAVATLCYALEFDWIPWATAPKLTAYLETHGVSFSRERVRVRINDIRDSFACAINPEKQS